MQKIKNKNKKRFVYIQICNWRIEINKYNDISQFLIKNIFSAFSQLIRVQSAEGIKRIEISPKANLKELFEMVHHNLKVDGFGLFKERNFLTEVSFSSIIILFCILIEDYLYIAVAF